MRTRQYYLNLATITRKNTHDEPNATEVINDIFNDFESQVKEMLEYIEVTEETIDGECGNCSFDELLKDKVVPKLYQVMIKLAKE